MKTDYTLVVPAYNCADQLHSLVEDIRAVTPEKYLPKRMILVDDASPDDNTRFAGPTLSTSALPIDVVTLDDHLGFPGAAIEGMKQVDTDYAILMHADTRLQAKLAFAKPIKIYKDALGVLATYIQSDPEIFAVAPTTLLLEKRRFIVGGMRQVSRNVVPCSRLASMMFEPIRQNKFLAWTSTHSLDTHCVAVQMQTYKEYPFFSEMGHFFFFDDWCFELRKQGKHCYVTTDTVVFHSMNKERPGGSSAVATSESYSDKLKLWQEKWRDTGLCRFDAPRRRVSTESWVV